MTSQEKMTTNFQDENGLFGFTKNDTNYFFEVVEDGNTESIPCGAHSDEEIIQWASDFVKFSRVRGRNLTSLFVCFFRQSDGCVGFINPDGNASATGYSWANA